MDRFRRFERNSAGRDFAVGDIHGCFSRLDEKLAQVRFDPGRDRLFSVGDLIDRGPESPRALEFLAKPWFHAVRGNHEQMAIDYAGGNLERSIYAYNGGGWFISLTPQERAPFVDAFVALPIAIEIDTGCGLVGIVHADCPVAHWSDLQEALHGPDRDAFENFCLWSRNRISSGSGEDVQGIQAILVGHTPVRRVTSLANVVYIDTGAVFGRDLTMLQLSHV